MTITDEMLESLAEKHRKRTEWKAHIREPYPEKKPKLSDYGLTEDSAETLKREYSNYLKNLEDNEVRYRWRKRIIGVFGLIVGLMEFLLIYGTIMFVVVGFLSGKLDDIFYKCIHFPLTYFVLVFGIIGIVWGYYDKHKTPVINKKNELEDIVTFANRKKWNEYLNYQKDCSKYDEEYNRASIQYWMSKSGRAFQDAVISLFKDLGNEIIGFEEDFSSIDFILRDGDENIAVRLYATAHPYFSFSDIAAIDRLYKDMLASGYTEGCIITNMQNYSSDVFNYAKSIENKVSIKVLPAEGLVSFVNKYSA